MDVILLERVAKLGQMGEVVSVKPGYARNFLLPKAKALRATEANRKKFESMKAQLEARNLELKQDAEAVASELDGTSYVLIRQAGEARRAHQRHVAAGAEFLHQAARIVARHRAGGR